MEVDGTRIKAARQIAGFSQEKLARKAGISRGALQLIESGKTLHPFPETIQVIAQTLGVQVESLLARPDPDSPPPAAPQALGGIPARPLAFVGREQDVAEIKRRLMAVAVAQTDTLTVVHGWPGVGKTTLATSICRDSDLERHFPDGICWCSLGRTPDVRSQLTSWAQVVGISTPPSRHGPSVRELSERLAYALRDKRILFVIDDLWDTRDLELLRVGGARSGMLITTRQASLADEVGLGAQVYRLGILDDAAGLELLRLLAPQIVEHHEADCREVISALEGLPLAIHVAASLLRAEARRGFEVKDLLEELRDDHRRLYDAAVPSGVTTEMTPTVARLMTKSTDLLDESARRLFAALGELAPKPAAFDAETAAAAWGLDDPRPYLAEFVDRGLLEVPERGRFQMHSLLRLHAHSLWEKLDEDGSA